MQATCDSWRTLAGSPSELYYTYAVKWLISLPIFAKLLTIVLLLSEDFGLSDQEAGWLYGLHGMSIAVLTIPAGFLIDAVGLRACMTLACMMEALACLVVAYTSSLTVVTWMLLLVSPIGIAVIVPAMKVAVKRFSAEHVRHEAFGMLYVVQNVAVGVAMLTITAGRFASGSTGLSPWRTVFLIVGIVAALAGAVAATIRDPQHVETSIVEPGPLLRDDGFWRLCALNTVFIFAYSNFRHMESTFPKFMHRMHGPDTLFELFVAINPLLVIVLVPLVVTELRRRETPVHQTLFIGSCVTAVSAVPFFFASTLTTAALYIVLLTLGEVIWSPKLIEYTLALCPEGKEGVYSTLASVPLFLSKFFVGGFSGHILAQDCPRSGACDARALWGVVMMSICITPALLALTNSYLFPSRYSQGKRADEP
jgi:MFS family permease